MELTKSWYLKTSPRLPSPACILRSKARRPVKPLMTLSISVSVSARSPGSGAVWSRASRSSARSICPLSSLSKAEKAERSSVLGDMAASASASAFMKTGMAIVWGADGGKNRETSGGLDGRPEYNRLAYYREFGFNLARRTQLG